MLVVVDADTGAIVATLPIGAGSDAAAFDPKRRKLILSSNGDGTLSVIADNQARRAHDGSGHRSHDDCSGCPGRLRASGSDSASAIHAPS